MSDGKDRNSHARLPTIPLVRGLARGLVTDLVAGSAHTQARALVHFVYTHRIGHWKPVSTALLTIDVVPPRVHGQGAAHTSAAEKLLATCVRAGWGPSGIVVGRRPDIMSLRGRFLGHEHPGIKVLQDNQDA